MSSYAPEQIPDPNRRRVLKLLGAVAASPTLSSLPKLGLAPSVPAIPDISLNVVTHEWLREASRLIGYTNGVAEMVSNLSANNGAQWLASNEALPELVAREVVRGPATITMLRNSLLKKSKNLLVRGHEISPAIIREQIAHEVSHGWIRLQPNQTIEGLTSEIYQFSQVPASQLTSAIRMMADPLEKGLENLTQLASDNPIIRREMHKLNGKKLPDTDDVKPAKKTEKTEASIAFPHFGTAHHPIRAGEYDEAQDFYGEYELDRPNTGISSVAAAELLGKAARYSKPTVYTHSDKRQWQTRIEQGHIPQPLDIKIPNR